MRIGLDSDSEMSSMDEGQAQVADSSLTARSKAAATTAFIFPSTTSASASNLKVKGKARQLDHDLHIQFQPGSPVSILSNAPENEASRKKSSKPIIPPWIARQQQRRRRNGGNKRLDYPSTDSDSDSDVDLGGSSSTSINSDLDSSIQNTRHPDSDSSSDDSLSRSYSEIDSEEEQWPVHPNRTGKAIGLGRNQSSRRKRDDEVVRRLIRMQSSAPEELPGRVIRTYAKASKNYTARLRSLSIAPTDSQPPSSSRQATPAARERDASEARAWLAQKELDEVNGILEGLQIKAKEDERKEEAAFEERQRMLWKSVEDSIRAAEKERDDDLAAKAAQLAAARKAQEERERKAKEQREAEERRIEEEKRVREENERKRLEEEEREAARAREEQVGGGISLKRDAKVEWEKWVGVMKDIKEKVLPYVSSNSDLRKQCFAAKRQITPKVGQLTNSRQEVVRITVAIAEILSAARNVSTPSGQSEVYVWILNHLSKCLIRQAEQEVAVKQDTAFPLSRVVRWLIDGGHEKLAEVLMARLVKKCPWVLAFCPERKASDNDATYSKMLGKSDSSESSVQYSGRMSGILAFYFAVLQSERTSPPQPLTAPNSDPSSVLMNFRPSYLWIWQSRAITPPFTNHGLSPSLWCCFLEIAGKRALDIYGKQTEKVWNLLLKKGIRERMAEFCKDDSAKPAVARLTRRARWRDEISLAVSCEPKDTLLLDRLRDQSWISDYTNEDFRVQTSAPKSGENQSEMERPEICLLIVKLFELLS